MSLFAIAFKNVKKNISFYFLYLVSVAFILTVFFSFVSFSMNGVMLAKISEDGRVETMSRTIAVFLMAFVLFYMSYSNQFFYEKTDGRAGNLRAARLSEIGDAKAAGI